MCSEAYFFLCLKSSEELSHLANSCCLLGLALMTPTWKSPLIPLGEERFPYPSEDISAQGMFMHLFSRDCKLLEGNDCAFLYCSGYSWVAHNHAVDIQQMFMNPCLITLTLNIRSIIAFGTSEDIYFTFLYLLSALTSSRVIMEFSRGW